MSKMIVAAAGLAFILSTGAQASPLTAGGAALPPNGLSYQTLAQAAPSATAPAAAPNAAPATKRVQKRAQKPKVQRPPRSQAQPQEPQPQERPQPPAPAAPSVDRFIPG
jgi:hypothetical protein